MELDFCFLTDVTGSMRRYVDGVRTDIKKIVREVESDYPVDIRAAFVGYRDYEDEVQFETFQLSPDLDAFEGMVSGVVATGGGDEAEDVFGGIAESLKLRWNAESTKVILHICDAPPHGRVYHGGHANDSHLEDDRWDMDDLFLKLKALGNMHYYIYSVNRSKGVAHMVNMFLATGMRLNVMVAEKRMEDVKELLSVSVSVLKRCIGLRVAKLGSLDTVVRFYVDDEEKGFDLEDSEFDVFVGVDFGTDGTAYAYCCKSEPGRMHMAQMWDGKMRDAGVKTRTCILLKENGLGDFEVVSFGSEAEDEYTAMSKAAAANMHFFDRFKMALFDESLVTAAADVSADASVELVTRPKVDIKSLLKSAGGKNVQSAIVLTKALQHIRDVIIAEVRKETAVDDIGRVQWILTVPAIWSDSAKKTMRQCAVAAKMVSDEIHDQLRIVHEPDCGSVTVRKVFTDLRDGEAYLLLDIGGGTADFSAHRRLNAVHIESIHYPTGDKFGSSYVDEAFFQLMATLIGADNWKRFKEENPTDYVAFRRNFRVAKHKFTGVGETPMIEVPTEFFDFIEKTEVCGKELDAVIAESEHSADVRMEVDDIKLSGEQWKALFSECVDGIVTHVKSLLALEHLSEIRRLFCVGGFCESQYLLTVLKKQFPTLKINTPEHPILAVVEGAAEFAMRPSVIDSYCSPQTYGLKVVDFWQESDPKSARFCFDAAEKRFVTASRFYPLLEIGQRISSVQPPAICCFTPVDESHTEIRVEMYATLKKKSEVRLVTDSGVKLIGCKALPLPSDYWTTDKRTKGVRVGFQTDGTEKWLLVEIGGAVKKVQFDWSDA